MHVVVKLTKPAHPVVRIDPEIQDLFRIRDLQEDIARDLSYNQAGAARSISYRRELLYSFQRSYFRRHGKAADVQRLKVTR